MTAIGLRAARSGLNTSYPCAAGAFVIHPHRPPSDVRVFVPSLCQFPPGWQDEKEPDPLHAIIRPYERTTKLDMVKVQTFRYAETEIQMAGRRPFFGHVSHAPFIVCLKFAVCLL